MNFVGVENAWLELEKSILLQAIEDYVHLKEKGVIYNCDKVNECKFSRYGNSKHGVTRHPLNFHTSKDVYDLIWFLKSSWLEFFCMAIGHRACRIRKRIGLVSGTGELLTAADLDYWHRCATQKKRF